MNKLLCLGIAVIIGLSLIGCGSSESLDIFVAHILSDQAGDGDIAFDPVLNSYTITNGPNILYFGIDESDIHFPEFRAFLSFPLDGSTNEDIVPAHATIVSATLEVFVDEVHYAGTIPTILDLITYPVLGLKSADFLSLPLQFPNGTDASLRFNFFSSDQGNFVLIDVTSLLRETQQRGLPDFQVRFMIDFTANAGFVGIEDRPNIAVTAPRLTVEFR